MGVQSLLKNKNGKLDAEVKIQLERLDTLSEYTNNEDDAGTSEIEERNYSFNKSNEDIRTVNNINTKK